VRLSEAYVTCSMPFLKSSLKLPKLASLLEGHLSKFMGELCDYHDFTVLLIFPLLVLSLCGKMNRAELVVLLFLYLDFYVCCTVMEVKLQTVLLSGMASVDSSAPETTSSDNSPTLVRRNFAGSIGGATAAGHHGGPGSDSGSSQSDSVESSSSGCKHMAQQAQQLRGALKAQQNDADRCVSQLYVYRWFS